MEKLTREQVIEKLNKDEKDFRHLDLSRLDLSGLDLSNMNLSYTNLSYANLSYANLECANLHCTILCYADLCHANLENAILSYTYLSNADLSWATLFGVNLEDTNLEKTILYNAKLDGKEKIRKGIILKESMIGYKKCRFDTIITLEIPKGAVVFSINNNKCRTNRAKVLEISDGKKVAFSGYDISFAYKLGKEIEIEDFDLRYNVECSSGIHFFRTKEEAENY